MLGALLLLMMWSAREVSPPEKRPKISTYLVFAKDKTPKRTQVSSKNLSTTARSRPSHGKPAPKQAQAASRPATHNGLLKPQETAPSEENKLAFFGKPTEFKRLEPDLRETKHDDYGWTSEIKRDGKVEFTDKPLIEPPTIVVDEDGFKIRLRMPDINEVVMRLRGDPMYDPQKRKYLSKTRDIREAKAQAFTREHLLQSLNDLGERLTTLWFDDALSVRAKRQRLFDMWEECAEEGTDIVLAMSEIVRVSIKSFIKRNMPKGSEVAYTDDDLIRLNKNRKSKTEFNPYG